MIVRIDVAALRGSMIWPGLRQQLAAISATQPGCDPDLVDRIADVVVAYRPGLNGGRASGVLVDVLGQVPRTKLVMCLDELSRATGAFSVREGTGGFEVRNRAGEELVAVKWTDRGLMGAVGGIAPGEGGPSPAIIALLGKVRLNSPLWAVSITDPSELGTPGSHGGARFEKLWFELRGASGGVVIRSGLRFGSSEDARDSINGIVAGFMKGLSKRGVQSDEASVRRRIRHEVRGRWILLWVRWSKREIAELLRRMASPR